MENSKKISTEKLIIFVLLGVVVIASMFIEIIEEDKQTSRQVAPCTYEQKVKITKLYGVLDKAETMQRRAKHLYKRGLATQGELDEVKQHVNSMRRTWLNLSNECEYTDANSSPEN